MGAYGTQNWPNFNAWLQVAWGSGASFETVCGDFYGATNLVFGQNPPYYLDDVQGIYPKFFGLPTPLSGCTATQGLATVTVPSANGLLPGQFAQAASVFAPGSVIVSISGNTVTLNQAALASATNLTAYFYTAPPIPVGVILMYLALANASLVQARWQEQWYVAMGWFIAHYVTLYARSDASEVFQSLQTTTHGEAPSGVFPGTVYTLSAPPPNATLQSLTKNGLFLSPSTDYTLSGGTITLTVATQANDKLWATWPTQVTALTAPQMNGAQIAAQALAGGIQTSKSVGDVSVAYQPLSALEDWGQWNLTLYGQQLATMASVIGSGPMVIW